MKLRSPLLAAMFTLPVTATPASAQSGNDLILEEILVVATKREQSMQDVSVAVTALTEDFIRESLMRTSEDLTNLVPSLNLQKGSNPRQSSFNIRGIGTQSYSIAVEPSVSTMLDGVVMGRSGQAFMQLLDIERVEVLRGPQGTLFGKNSSAGVIHVITRNPTEEHTGELMGTVVSDDEYRAGLTVSGPFTDSLGYRLSAYGSDLGDYTRNYYDGDDLNGADEWSVRGKLRWLATDNLEFKWASDYADYECDCTAAPLRSIEPWEGNDDYVQGVLDLIAPAEVGDEANEVNHNTIPSQEGEQWGHSLEVNWDIGEYTLTSITAARGSEIIADNGDGDLDGQPITVLPMSQGGDTEQDQFTQELRLASPADTAFNYIVGLFYFDQEVDRRFIRDFEFVPGNPGQGVADFVVETDNWAAFGEANWQFADDWQLIFGARYTQDELDWVFERTVEGSPIGLPEPVSPTRGGTDEDDLSGKLGLQWDFQDSAMTYLSYTEGYKGPGYDLTIGSDPEGLERVEPELSGSWELGLKSTLWGGRLMLNAALFHTVYEDFQGQAYFDPDGQADCPIDQPGCDPDDDPGGFVLTNAGEVQTQGLELDFMAQMTENLRLSGGLALVDATIEDYEEGPCSDGQQYRGECDENGIQDISGGHLPFSPDWKLNLAAAYTWGRDHYFDVIFRGMLRAQDEVQFGLHQDENTIADSYGVLDLSAQLLAHSDRWEATFFVKNVTDEFYPSNIYDINQVFIVNAYFHRYNRDAERRYGMELRYRW